MAAKFAEQVVRWQFAEPVSVFEFIPESKYRPGDVWARHRNTAKELAVLLNHRSTS
jgi:hypothetical protein